MLSQTEWATAYAYLLERLHALELSDVAAEIEAAAAMRIVEEYKPAYPGQFSLTELSEQSETVTRARRPDEAWLAALSVLNTYLIEVPKIAARIGQLLDRAPSQILFLPDAREDEITAAVPRFTLAELTFREEEAQEVIVALERFAEIGQARENARPNPS